MLTAFTFSGVSVLTPEKATTAKMTGAMISIMSRPRTIMIVPGARLGSFMMGMTAGPL